MNRTLDILNTIVGTSNLILYITTPNAGLINLLLGALCLYLGINGLIRRK